MLALCSSTVLGYDCAALGFDCARFEPSPKHALPARQATELIQRRRSTFEPREACPTFEPRVRNRPFQFAWCGIEWDEWVMVAALITPNDAVLEFGARYGTTSCSIAAATNNSGRVVAVEPDKSVHDMLLRNRAANTCNFALVPGTVAARIPLKLRSMNDYATKTLAAERSTRPSYILPNLSLRQVEANLVGHLIDTLLLDCEGCIANLDWTELLQHTKLVLMEEDGNVDYAAWKQRLKSLDFINIWRAADTFGEAWSRGLVHSAWARGFTSRRKYVSCQEFAGRKGLTSTELNCLPLEM